MFPKSRPAGFVSRWKWTRSFTPSFVKIPWRTEEPFNMGALIKQGSGLVKQVQSTIGDIQNRADKAIDNITSLSDTWMASSFPFGAISNK